MAIREIGRAVYALISSQYILQNFANLTTISIRRMEAYSYPDLRWMLLIKNLK